MSRRAEPRNTSPALLKSLCAQPAEVHLPFIAVDQCGVEDP
jgi:hypothetical protein